LQYYFIFFNVVIFWTSCSSLPISEFSWGNLLLLLQVSWVTWTSWERKRRLYLQQFGLIVSLNLPLNFFTTILYSLCTPLSLYTRFWITDHGDFAATRVNQLHFFLVTPSLWEHPKEQERQRELLTEVEHLLWAWCAIVFGFTSLNWIGLDRILQWMLGTL
jgi:hypothetical protein